MQNLIATTFEVVHYIALQAVHYKPLQEVHLSRYNQFNDIALLADLMGHESIETTRIYLRRTASEQQDIVDKVVIW